MYYCGKYIGDIPNVLLRGNLNYTNAKHILTILNRINKEILNKDFSAQVIKVGPQIINKQGSKKKKETIQLPNGFIISDKFGFFLQPKWISNRNIFKISDTELWVKDLDYIHYLVSDYHHKTRTQIERLYENNKTVDKKLELAYNQIDFITTWVGSHNIGKGADYMGEITYDDGTVWEYPYNY